MSRTANDEANEADPDWADARNRLFRMIMEGRSFSGRERNCCFLNTRDGQFATISGVSGIDFPDDARALALTDWDQDGDVDLWVSNRNAPRIRYLENQSAATTRSIALRLVGNGQTTNRDAIGARVEVVARATPAGPARRIQTLHAGQGFLSQSSKWLHFGLGQTEQIERVEVDWPGGIRETFTGLRAGDRYELIQGSTAPRLVARNARPAKRQASALALPKPPASRHVSLRYRVPMPTISYQEPQGRSRPIELRAGRATLIVLWASWCVPCIEELSQLAEHGEQLTKAAVDVLALNVDQLAKTDDRSAPEIADETFVRLQLPFVWGTIDAEQMNRLQGLHDQFFFLKRPLPLPASFLVDAQGRLAALYLGPVDVDQLVKDATRTPGDVADAMHASACLPGRTLLNQARVREVAHREELQTRYHVAAWLSEVGSSADALQGFEELASADPQWALPLRHLAKLQLSANRLPAARSAAERACTLEPQNAGAHHTLGLILSAQADPAGAEASLRRAVTLDPHFAEAYNNLGTVLATQGRLSAAREAFAQAVQLDPQFVQAHTNLGSALAALQDIAGAIKEYEAALRIDSNYVDAYNNLGTMHARLGNYRRAAQYYQQVLRIDPQHADARRNLNLAIQQGNSDR